MTQSKFVEIDGIRKRFGDYVALGGVNLDIREGEMMFLLGPSGCGKTTLLRIIAGLIEQDTGAIRCRGQDLAGLAVNKRGFGYVFQNYALFPHRTVGENVAFGLKVRGVAKSEREDRVKRALDLVQLAGLQDRYPRQLSGGQQQRVALARALIIEPPLLLLDEPLSNLDAKLREDMRLEVRHIQERLEVTTIFVTHDQQEALSMGDRVAIMRGGRIDQCGSPREVYDSPATEFVSRFLGRANLIRGTAIEVGADMALVRVVSGETVSARLGSVRPSPGQGVDVMVRPEVMSIADVQATAGDYNRIGVTVKESVFNGSTSTTFCIAGDGSTFEAEGLGSTLMLDSGRLGALSWQPMDSVVIVNQDTGITAAA